MVKVQVESDVAGSPATGEGGAGRDSGDGACSRSTGEGLPGCKVHRAVGVDVEAGLGDGAAVVGEEQIESCGGC